MLELELQRLPAIESMPGLLQQIVVALVDDPHAVQIRGGAGRHNLFSAERLPVGCRQSNRKAGPHSSLDPHASKRGQHEIWTPLRAGHTGIMPLGHLGIVLSPQHECAHCAGQAGKSHRNRKHDRHSRVEPC